MKLLEENILENKEEDFAKEGEWIDLNERISKIKAKYNVDN